MDYSFDRNDRDSIIDAIGKINGFSYLPPVRKSATTGYIIADGNSTPIGIMNRSSMGPNIIDDEQFAKLASELQKNGFLK